MYGIVVLHGKLPRQRHGHAVSHDSNDERVDNEGGCEVGGEWIGDRRCPVRCADQTPVKSRNTIRASRWVCLLLGRKHEKWKWSIKTNQILLQTSYVVKFWTMCSRVCVISQRCIKEGANLLVRLREVQYWCTCWQAILFTLEVCPLQWWRRNFSQKIREMR